VNDWGLVEKETLDLITPPVDLVNQTPSIPDEDNKINQALPTERTLVSPNDDVEEAICIALSCDGNILALATENAMIWLWSLFDTTWKREPLRLEEFTWANALAFSPVSDNILASALRDTTVALWDINTQACLKVLEGHKDAVLALAYSPNGEMLASTSYDKTIILWNTADGRRLATLKDHSYRVTAVAFSSDGSVLATGSFGGTIILYSMSTMRPIQSVVEHPRAIKSFAFSEVSNMLVSADAFYVTISWSILEGRDPLMVITQKTDRYSVRPHASQVFSVAFSADSKFLALGTSAPSIGLWNNDTSEQILELEVQESIVRCLAFSPVDESIVVSALEDGSVRLWNLGNIKA